MFITYTLFLLSYFEVLYVRVGIGLCMSTLLFFRKQYRDLRSLLIIFALFIFFHSSLSHYSFKKAIVTQKTNTKVVLRSGLNLYDAYDLQWNVGDVVTINEIKYYETRTAYQKSHRILGVASLKHNTNPHQQNSLQVEEHFTTSLSLALVGFEVMAHYIFRKRFKEATWKKFNPVLVLLYGLCFGFNYAVKRIFIRTLVKQRKHQCIILLTLYPGSAHYIGFLFVYFPYLLKESSPHFKHLNETLVRMLLALRYFNKVNIMQLLLYRMVSIMSALSLLIDHSLIDWIHNSRFQVVGSISWLLIIGISLLSMKKQIILTCLILLFNTYYPFYRLTMIDVGQGDSFLITYPLNIHTVLIDTGKPSQYTRVKKQLYKHGIQTLDALIVTHPDLDHNGNQDILIKEFNVKTLIDQKKMHPQGFISLLDAIDFEDTNDNSLILYTKVYDTSILFMGDASVEVERMLLKHYPNLKVDLLKLGHHGSKTSSSLEFLKSVQPQIALISSNPKQYNHPHPEIMNRLQSLRILPILSAESQSVSIIFTPFLNKVVSEAGGFGIMK